jgi:hypothetical protein
MISALTKLNEKGELAWCMLKMMSDPPTNSPLMNICGNVGQLLHRKKTEIARAC